MNGRRVRAWRLGLFTLVGLTLLVAAVVAVFGLRLFARSDPVVMHFDGSLYGLSVGAAVRLRGLQVGRVTDIGLAHDGPGGGLRLPVQAELDGAQLDRLLGRPAPAQAASGTVAVLVQRGLNARLVTQSLLTGQRYIELDLPAAQPGAQPPPATTARARGDGRVEIPGVAPEPSLQDRLAQLDLARLVQEATAAAAAVRALGSSAPQLERSLAELGQAAASLNRLAHTLRQRSGPLAEAAQATLADTRRAASAVEAGSRQLSAPWAQAGERVGAAASQVQATLAPEAALPRSLQQAADEVARSAASLRRAVGDESALPADLQRSLAELSQAAQAVRDLAQMLRRHPNALLFGAPAAAASESSR